MSPDFSTSFPRMRYASFTMSASSYRSWSLFCVARTTPLIPISLQILFWSSAQNYVIRTSASLFACAGILYSKSRLFRRDLTAQRPAKGAFPGSPSPPFSPPGAKGLGVLHHLPIFRQFFQFHKNPQSSVSFQAHSPVKTVFRQNPKNTRKSQNTPSTNPYQHETQFPLRTPPPDTPDHPKVYFALP
jgi:hypothetical protein